MVISPINSWGNRGTERFNNSLKATQLGLKTGLSVSFNYCIRILVRHCAEQLCISISVILFLLIRKPGYREVKNSTRVTWFVSKRARFEPRYLMSAPVPLTTILSPSTYWDLGQSSHIKPLRRTQGEKRLSPFLPPHTHSWWKLGRQDSQMPPQPGRGGAGLRQESRVSVDLVGPGSTTCWRLPTVGGTSSVWLEHWGPVRLCG